MNLGLEKDFMAFGAFEQSVYNDNDMKRKSLKKTDSADL